MADKKHRSSSSGREEQKRSGMKKKPHKRGSARKKRMRAKRRKIIMKRALITLVLAGIVYGIVQLLLFLDVRKYEGDTALDGVYIDDIDVSGMTSAQIEKELEKRMLD